MRTFTQPTLIDMSAVVAHCIGNVEGEVGAACFNRSAHQGQILFFGKMLVQVDVAC